MGGRGEPGNGVHGWSVGCLRKGRAARTLVAELALRKVSTDPGSDESAATIARGTAGNALTLRCALVHCPLGGSGLPGWNAHMRIPICRHRSVHHNHGDLRHRPKCMQERHD